MDPAAPSAKDCAKTFALSDEDHTLGNALRHVLNRHPEVHLTGYNVPHPSETSVHVRVQTKGNMASRDVMREACGQLEEMCDIVKNKFEAAVQAHGGDSMSE